MTPTLASTATIVRPKNESPPGPKLVIAAKEEQPRSRASAGARSRADHASAAVARKIRSNRNAI